MSVQSPTSALFQNAALLSLSLGFFDFLAEPPGTSALNSQVQGL